MDWLLTVLTLGIVRFVFVREGTNRVITRFGKYRRTLEPGLRAYVSLWGLLGMPYRFQITDPTTGELRRTAEVDVKEIVFDYPRERVISRVVGRNDLWRGDRLADLPDLVVVPAGGWSITGRPERDERLCRPIVPGEDFHVGRHHPEGIVAAAGAGVRPGTGIRTRLIDIAPTVLAAMGIEPPPTMDGEIAGHLFADPLPITRSVPPAADAAPTDRPDLEEPAYTPEEEALVEKRLRDLGYL